MLTRLLVGAVALLPSSVHAIWPIPKEFTSGDNVLYIDQTVEITYNGASVCWISSPNPSCPDREFVDSEILMGQLPYTYGYAPPPGPKCKDKDIVQAAVSRAFEAIFQHNFVPWKLRPAHGDWEPDVYAKDKGRVESLTITHTVNDDETCYKPLAGELDESYTFELTKNGAATIEAQTSVGVLRALETFIQLFYQHSSGTSWYTEIAPVSIKDEPEYPHRGLLLDVSRSWYPVEDILHMIDTLSWNKMNRIHIHMTDSQSWPLEIPAMPKLAEKGSYGKGMTYSPADLAHIQEYASHRGVQVIVEIDMPGHIGSVHHSYPDLIVAYNEKPYHWWCAQPPCGAFKMNSSAVYDFLETLFDDLLPRLAPYSSYFHTGGDELNRNDSMLDEGVRSNDTDVLRPLLQKFLDVNHGRVRKAGLTPMVWEEMAIEWEQNLGKDVVVQSWLGGDAVKNITSKGYKVIDSNYHFWYLDCGRGAWLDFENGAAYNTFYPFNDWCGPTHSWQAGYSHDPRAGLGEEQAKLVLGGEVAVWSETIDPLTVDTIVWPRAGAAGEVLWSGRQDASGTNRSLVDAAARLAEMRERLVARGVRAAHITELWCLQDPDPLACQHAL
ncbi:related to beta-hexosaminidase precursor [Cephalotrichum gorgonifer]|uniref:Beta-hexosaminidase n=1 Tax=Cephalotrichum gorgonifer TaxID=2041049 RepID=A0AAE8MQF6_9PEZI|nr:related to beta-hexosaminidase precursor [Cephalotrichum gorgonifer]